MDFVNVGKVSDSPVMTAPVLVRLAIKVRRKFENGPFAFWPINQIWAFGWFGHILNLFAKLIKS
jgi:hypothetical protein